MGASQAILLLLISIGISFYWQFPRYIWGAFFAGLLFTLTYFLHAHWLVMGVAWLVFIATALVINVKPWRITLITTPFLHYFRRVLPPMSQTEQEAIEAGNVCWEGELFRGAPNWKGWFSESKPVLTKEEESFINHQTETLCHMINDWQILRQDYAIPEQVWQYLKKERFFAMIIPKEYGGLGFSALAHSAVISKIASRSLSVAVTTMVPNSLGPAELLLHYGTEAQKSYYLPRLAESSEIPCFALTGPEAGSDAGGLPDKGIVCYGEHEGKEVLGIRLSWDKRYITLAPIATVLGLAFKLEDPEALIGKKVELGITLALIPTNHPGVEIGTRHMPVGLAILNGVTRGKEVFIPMEWIIGGVDMIGKGWRMLVECLAVGRAISLPGLSTAVAKVSYRMTGAYARIRKQFKTSIGYFEGVQQAMARIAAFTYMLEATRHYSAHLVDQRNKPSVISAIAKYNMTEAARIVLNAAMDVHAGRAVQDGPRNYLINLYLVVPMCVSVEGANILTRNLMIFGQGAIRCHPYIRDEIESAKASTPDLFDSFFVKHLGYTLRNFVRTFVYGLTGARFCKSFLKGKAGFYEKKLTHFSSMLAFLSDVAMMLMGGELKRRESLSARLGDILSVLYLGSCVLRYAKENNNSKEDELHVSWILPHLLHRAQEAVYNLLNNLPQKFFAKLLARIVFPWGRVYESPKDEVSREIAEIMMSPSAFRDRITKYCYVSHNESDATGRMEVTLARCIDAMPAESKLQQAIKTGTLSKHLNFSELLVAAKNAQILTEEEIACLEAYEVLRKEAIKVDEFLFKQ